MINLKRWTIRNIDPEMIAVINDIRGQSGATSGALVNEAILDWYENLEEEDAEDDQDDV